MEHKAFDLVLCDILYFLLSMFTGHGKTRNMENADFWKTFEKKTTPVVYSYTQ